MRDLEELQHEFGVSGVVKFVAGGGGLTKIVVKSVLASAEIYMQGAHVTHFAPRNGGSVLFLSRSSMFQRHKAIRGGVPLVFPWFGPRAGHPEAPLHGFARTRIWDIESCDLRSDGSVRVVLSSASDDQTLAVWPHTFSMRLVVIIANNLDMTLEVRNTSDQGIEFEEAMHSYLAVGNVRSIAIEGLEGVEYLDRADGETRKRQSEHAIGITGETDRLYFNTSGPVTVRDASLNRSITMEKEHSDSTVIWNPWTEKAKAMADLGAEQWQSMVCVESANARENRVRLAAGGIHRMTTRISAGG